MEPTTSVAQPTQTLEVNLGPQHPSTHGVFRMIATLDGETIVKLKPVMGYLHRNHEQIDEQITYIASFPFTARVETVRILVRDQSRAASAVKTRLLDRLPQQRHGGLRDHAALRLP